MPTQLAAPESPALDLERLRTGFRGPVIGPDDEGYREARSIWNGAIDRRPAMHRPLHRRGRRRRRGSLRARA